jgi:alanyl-tRNA synthetase
VVFAQTKGLERDMGALLRETLKQVGGKGGGAKDFAQGSVADASKAGDVVALAQKSLETA